MGKNKRGKPGTTCNQHELLNAQLSFIMQSFKSLEIFKLSKEFPEVMFLHTLKQLIHTKKMNMQAQAARQAWMQTIKNMINTLTVHVVRPPQVSKWPIAKSLFFSPNTDFWKCETYRKNKILEVLKSSIFDEFRLFDTFKGVILNIEGSLLDELNFGETFEVILDLLVLIRKNLPEEVEMKRWIVDLVKAARQSSEQFVSTDKQRRILKRMAMLLQNINIHPQLRESAIVVKQAFEISEIKPHQEFFTSQYNYSLYDFNHLALITDNPNYKTLFFQLAEFLTLNREVDKLSKFPELKDLKRVFLEVYHSEWLFELLKKRDSVAKSIRGYFSNINTYRLRCSTIESTIVELYREKARLLRYQESNLNWRDPVAIGAQGDR